MSVRELDQVDSPLAVRIDQMTETPLSRPIASCWADIQYLYARSSDSRTNHVKGQDYLAFKCEGCQVLFAVCDGVGSSFCGDLAAQFLGDALVDWLATLDADIDANTLAQQANVFLQDLTAQGRQRILEYPIQDDLPPLIKDALEGQRAYGSESMFVCGRLELAPDQADLSRAGRVMLCWLGDAQVQALASGGEPVDIGAQWTSQERWSMLRGIKGADSVHVWIGDLDGIERIIAHSDGLGSVAQQLYQLIQTPESLQEQVELLYNSPGSDDISLVDIRIKAELQLLPPPKWCDGLGPQVVGAFLLRWTAVPGADAYVLEESSGADFAEVRRAWRLRTMEKCVAGQPFGDYYYRVSAAIGGLAGEPSVVRQVHLRPHNWLKIILLIMALAVCLILVYVSARLLAAP